MTTREKWEVVDETPGILQGEILRGLLKASGITVRLAQEGAAQAIGLLGAVPMASVLVMVPTSQREDARRLLEDYYAGNLDANA